LPVKFNGCPGFRFIEPRTSLEEDLVMNGMKRHMVVMAVAMSWLFLAAAVYAGAPAGWPEKLPGRGEFNIFIHQDLRDILDKLEVTIRRVDGAPVFSGTTLICKDGEYRLEYPFSCSDFLTMEPIHYVKDAEYLHEHAQVNRGRGEQIGHIGHAYDILTSGRTNRPYILGYGLYEISMTFFYSRDLYTQQRWFVDLMDPNYPYDTHGYPRYYDICFCVNKGDNTDYSATAYLGTSDWSGYTTIPANGTGRLADAFSYYIFHRNEIIGLGPSQFQPIPVSASISGPEKIKASLDHKVTPTVAEENAALEGEGLSAQQDISMASAVYTARAACGNQQYTYLWHIKKPESSHWVFQGKGERITISQDTDFYLRCSITSGTETAVETKFVTVVKE